MEENRMLMDEQPEQPAELTAAETAEAAETGAREALAGLKAELEAALEEKLRRMLEEADRLSRMTDAERAAYAASQREGELAERERRIAQRELRAEALEELARRGLPKALADAVANETPEGMRASLDAVERAFRQAVQAAVEARLRGETPAAGASAQGGDADLMDDETYYRMNAARL